MATVDAKFKRLVNSKRPSKDVASILGVSQRTVQRYRAAGQTNPKTGQPKQARKASTKTVARTPAKLPRAKPYAGKLKARKADRRLKRNTAPRVTGAKRIGAGARTVRMHATYDFTDSPGRDARHRAVTFKLLSSEAEKLNRMIEGGADVQEVADFLTETKGAGYMNEATVYNIEEIKVP